MAMEGVNARGGILRERKVDLVIEDDSGTPEEGAAGVGCGGGGPVGARGSPAA